MARDNGTGTYMLLVYKPRFVLRHNFSTCTEIQRANQVSLYPSARFGFPSLTGLHASAGLGAPS